MCAYRDKAAWLSELDMKTDKEFFSYFSDNERHFEGGYSQAPEAELIIPEPFCQCYVYFLAMRSALSEGDVAGYSNFSQLFANEYLAFRNHYSRVHTFRPLGIKLN